MHCIHLSQLQSVLSMVFCSSTCQTFLKTTSNTTTSSSECHRNGNQLSKYLLKRALKKNTLMLFARHPYTGKHLKVKDFA